MFSSFPTLIIPVSTFSPVENALTGTITANQKILTGTGTYFVNQLTIGSELFVIVDEISTSIGIVGVIDSNTTLKLEEVVPFAVVGKSATAKTYIASSTGIPIEYTDIFRRVIVSDRYKNSASFLLPYVVTEGETIEAVSTKFYGIPEYHWVIILVNTIVNTREEWPLTEQELMKKIAALYTGAPTDTYEHRDVETGYVVSAAYAASHLTTTYAVSILDYETEKNEAKRNIKVLNPGVLTEFVNDFYRTINEG